MDKKNTILLTVIAVATLLVAVVGATFAYYSVEHLNSTSRINIKATADPVGAITLYTPNTELGMTITPTDMAIPNAGNKFYALVYQPGGTPSPSTPNQAPDTTKGIYGIERHNHIMTRAVLVGGNEETAYTCTSKLKVTLDMGEGSMGKVLQERDAIMYFTTRQTTMKRPGEEEYKTEQTLDLNDLTKLGGSTQEIVYDLIYKVNGDTVAQKREANIYADLEITNLEDRDQRYLAGADKDVIKDQAPGTNTAGSGTKGAQLTVYLETTEFSCTIDPVKAVNN